MSQTKVLMYTQELLEHGAPMAEFPSISRMLAEAAACDRVLALERLLTVDDSLLQQYGTP